MSRAIAVTIALSVLTACGSDPEPRFEADPTSSPTLSTSPTPDDPEPWEEKSDEGAIAFVEHWIDLFNASTSSGETAELRRASSTSCRTCGNFAELTERVYGAGGKVEGGEWTIASTSEPQKSAGAVLISLDIRHEPQTVVEASGEDPKEYSGGKVDYLATIQWSDGQWMMLRLDVVQ